MVLDCFSTLLLGPGQRNWPSGHIYLRLFIQLAFTGNVTVISGRRKFLGRGVFIHQPCPTGVKIRSRFCAE